MPCTYVVGIAENIKQQSLGVGFGIVLLLFAGGAVQPEPGRAVRARDAGTRRDAADGIRRRLQREMPGASYVTIDSDGADHRQQTRSWHLGATMFAAFGVLALALAAIGLYSVIAYNVAQRTHELGVRVAIGAQAADLIRLVVTDGLRLAVAGVAIGAAVALYAARWVKPLLFDVSPTDPLVFGGVVFVLLAHRARRELAPRAAGVEGRPERRAQVGVGHREQEQWLVVGPWFEVLGSCSCQVV